MSVTILCGDAEEQLATLPANSVHCVVTSPPYYALRDYQTATWEDGDPNCDHQPRRAPKNAGFNARWGEAEGARKQETPRILDHRAACARCGAVRVDRQIGLEETPEAYIERLVGVFRAVGRVLRPDGTLWLNMGDSYASAWPCNRRNLVGQGSLENGKRENRPPRMGAGLKEKDLMMMPHRLAIALQADGWWVRSDMVWSKGNPMPESVRDRPTRSHEYLFLLTKRARYFWDQEAVREPGVYPAGTRGAKGSAERREQYGVNGRPPEYKIYDGRRNMRSVLTIQTQAFAEAHFATFPEKLVEPCLKAGTSERGCCPRCGAPWRRLTDPAPEYAALLGRDWSDPDRDEREGRGHFVLPDGQRAGQRPVKRSPRAVSADYRTVGWESTCTCLEPEPVPAVVLDPFAGSGTVGVVAEKLGRDAILIELNPEYCALAARRIAPVKERGPKPARPKRVWEQMLLPMEAVA